MFVVASLCSSPPFFFEMVCIFNLCVMQRPVTWQEYALLKINELFSFIYILTSKTLYELFVNNLLYMFFFAMLVIIIIITYQLIQRRHRTHTNEINSGSSEFSSDNSTNDLHKVHVHSPLQLFADRQSFVRGHSTILNN